MSQARLTRAVPTRASPVGHAWMNADVRPMGFGTPGSPGWKTRAEAVLWVGDTLRLVGTNGEVKAEAHRLGIEPEDLDGRIVTPGFVDAHTHFLHVGVKTTRPDLRGAKSQREAMGRLAAWLASHPGSAPVIAEGWDESEWGTPERPTRDDVDAVVSAAAREGLGPLDRPVVLRRICGHIAVASSGALPLIRARWDDDAAVNMRTGLLLEAPSLYLNEVLPSTPDQLDRAVQAACKEAHRLGVTAVGDYSQAPYRLALQRAAARGQLTVRTFSSIYVQQLEAERAAGFRTGNPASVGGIASPWLRDGGLKVFLDGSLGARTAYLREPYVGVAEDGKAGAKAALDSHAEHGHEGGGGAEGGGVGPRGSKIWSDEQLDHHFGVAHRAGIQIHAHAIGDGAIDQGLDAFERLAAHEDLEGRGWAHASMPERMASSATEGGRLESQSQRSRPPEATTTAQGRKKAAGSVQQGVGLVARAPAEGAGEVGAAAHATMESDAGPLRHRFEHFEIVHDDQMRRTAALGIVASSQPNFVGEWSAKGGMYEARLGRRFLVNNRFVSFNQAGIPLAFGSDGMPFGPLVGLNSAVLHPDANQRLPPEQAIWHYTTASAWAIHWGDAIGCLRPGWKADLVALETHTLDTAPMIWGIHATVTGGIRRT